MVPVKVDQLFLSNLGFVVLLKGNKDDRSLPIFIGAAEAQAIAIQLNDVTMPRPLTHDLIKNVLDFLECRLMRIEICDLREGTFYAKLVLDRDGSVMTLDSRPSDAIALALRCAAPIVVDEKIMDEAGKVFDQSELGNEPAGMDASHEPAEHSPAEDAAKTKRLTPLELLERQLARAIQQERYEDAARFRDEIKRMEGPNSEN